MKYMYRLVFVVLLLSLWASRLQARGVPAIFVEALDAKYNAGQSYNLANNVYMFSTGWRTNCVNRTGESWNLAWNLYNNSKITQNEYNNFVADMGRADQKVADGNAYLVLGTSAWNNGQNQWNEAQKQFDGKNYPGAKLLWNAAAGSYNEAAAAYGEKFAEKNFYEGWKLMDDWYTWLDGKK